MPIPRCFLNTFNCGCVEISILFSYDANANPAPFSINLCIYLNISACFASLMPVLPAVSSDQAETLSLLLIIECFHIIHSYHL